MNNENLLRDAIQLKDLGQDKAIDLLVEKYPGIHVLIIRAILIGLDILEHESIAVI